MPVPVLASHPSPASLVPRRGRTARHGWEALVSPVSLREAEQGAFAPLSREALGGCDGIRDELFLHEGAAWAVLGDHGPDGFLPFPREDLLAFLRSGTHPNPVLRDAFDGALRFTPFLPVAIAVSRHYEARTAGDGAWRLDPQPGDRVAFEERERSGAALQAWLDANLVLCGDRAMVRRPLFAEITTYAARKDFILETGFFPTPYGRIPIRPDLARSAAGSMRYGYETGGERNLAAIEALTAGLCTDDDLVRLANHLPVLVDADARTGAGTAAYRRSLRDPGRAEAVLDRLRPWALRGAIAGVARQEAADVLALCVSAIADLREAGVPLNSLFPDLVAQVERDFLPRLSELAPEDEAALSMTAR